MLAFAPIHVGLAGAQTQPGHQTTLTPGKEKKEAKSCTISASGVDFGVYDTLNLSPTDATGSITYVCSQGNGASNVIVTIDQGRAGSFDRTMTSAGETLRYNLYLDVGRTQIWGDGSGGTATLQDKVPAHGKPTTATVFGRLAPKQNVGAGLYTDGLVVTIQF